jgi:RecB family endonuclease NucS
MPIEFGLWRIDGEGYSRLSSTKLDDESRLEDLIVEDPNMLGRDLLIVGRQVHTDSGNRLDLLGIDVEGDLHLIELKRDRTPKDVVAQALRLANESNRSNRIENDDIPTETVDSEALSHGREW